MKKIRDWLVRMIAKQTLTQFREFETNLTAWIILTGTVVCVGVDYLVCPVGRETPCISALFCVAACLVGLCGFFCYSYEAYRHPIREWQMLVFLLEALIAAGVFSLFSHVSGRLQLLKFVVFAFVGAVVSIIALYFEEWLIEERAKTVGDAVRHGDSWWFFDTRL